MRNRQSYVDAGRLGAIASRATHQRKKRERIEAYNASPKSCNNCGVGLPYEKRANKYCSHSCAAKFNNIGVRRHGASGRETCKNCGKSIVGKKGKLYCSQNCHSKYKWKTKKQAVENGEIANRPTIKKYLIEARGYKCEICSNTQWRGQPIPLELDHIDGRSDNNILENLRLVCPNCHALTPTYKGKNNGNGRARRRQRYRDGKSY